MNRNETILISIFFSILMVAAGAIIYEQRANAPQPEKFLLSISITPTSKDIGNITITNSNSYTYNIQGAFFNVSLEGFVNYTLTFQYKVIYNGISNTTAHVYLQRNLSVVFKTSGSATPGPIYIG